MLVATAANRTVSTTDPSAHAEVLAIQAAAKQLGKTDLSGCTLYTTCEPCPMCYGLALWAGPSEIVCGQGTCDNCPPHRMMQLGRRSLADPLLTLGLLNVRRHHPLEHGTRGRYRLTALPTPAVLFDWRLECPRLASLTA